MEELLELCKAEGLSLMLDYNNHKRYKMSVREYADEFWGDGFKDEEGERWLQAMERRDTIVCIVIFDAQIKSTMRNYDVSLDSCIKDVIHSIKAGIHKGSQVTPTDYSSAPLD